jgi:hypothetical protein
MNKIAALIVCLFFQILVFAQAPEAIKYQSVARNLAGQTINNTQISVRLSIIDQTSTGITLYDETHSPTTNEFGLFSINIGTGTNVTGDFSTIDWGTNDKFLKVEADFLGGTNFVEMGTSQLLSVPYALYAKYAGTALLPNGTTAGNTAYWDGSQWIVNNSNIHNNGGFVGIGLNNPVQRLDVYGQVNIPTDSAYMINNRKILHNRGLANLIIGNNAGLLSTFGQYNVFAGHDAGLNNTIGSQNTFIGAETGVNNLDGMMNSFIGRRAGYLNTSGTENTFIGCYAGQNNSTGLHNSFLGVTTGNNNTTGGENTFLGAHAGYFNSTGNNNTYVGNFAGQYSTTGSNNLFLGFNADAATSNLNNAIAIGAGSIVTASNSVIIGNTSMTSIGGQVGWSTFSDRRLKNNIQEEKLGLNFILKLNPMRYQYSASGQEGSFYSGLIAQDVELLLTEMNLQFSGLVLPKNDSDFYSIRYAEFVIPLINAVQEQQIQIETLHKQNEILLLELQKVQELEERLKKLEKDKE